MWESPRISISAPGNRDQNRGEVGEVKNLLEQHEDGLRLMAVLVASGISGMGIPRKQGPSSQS